MGSVKVRPVSIDLGRRLIAAGLVSPEEVEAALFLSVARGVPFTRVLIDRGVISERGLEEELERVGGLGLRQVAGAAAIWARLPRAMCRRLAALPTRVDPTTGAVDVAAADPLDPHVGSEFSFHFGAPIRVLRAPIAAVEEAIRRLELDDTDVHEGAHERARHRRVTPPFPHGAPQSSIPPPMLDAAPIPLVRKIHRPRQRSGARRRRSTTLHRAPHRRHARASDVGAPPLARLAVPAAAGRSRPCRRPAPPTPTAATKTSRARQASPPPAPGTTIDGPAPGPGTGTWASCPRCRSPRRSARQAGHRRSTRRLPTARPATTRAPAGPPPRPSTPPAAPRPRTRATASRPPPTTPTPSVAPPPRRAPASGRAPPAEASRSRAHAHDHAALRQRRPTGTTPGSRRPRRPGAPALGDVPYPAAIPPQAPAASRRGLVCRRPSPVGPSLDDRGRRGRDPAAGPPEDGPSPRGGARAGGAAPDHVPRRGDPRGDARDAPRGAPAGGLRGQARRLLRLGVQRRVRRRRPPPWPGDPLGPAERARHGHGDGDLPGPRPRHAGARGAAPGDGAGLQRRRRRGGARGRPPGAGAGLRRARRHHGGDALPDRAREDRGRGAGEAHRPALRRAARE